MTISGFKVPDLGVHVLDVSEIEIDISLGEGLDNQSVVGLFEILNLLKKLSTDTIFEFEASNYHPSGQLFLYTFQSWLTKQSSPSKPK